MSNPEVVEELRQLIAQQGRITFAQFQKACLYSPRGGFYSSRANAINDHFSTSPTNDPVFGALLARQLEQMWRLMGEPARFDVLEVGSGDGALARSIVDACHQSHPELAQALRYVAADYEPWWPESAARPMGDADADSTVSAGLVQRVKAEGLRGFRGVQGCILTNELHDNFPVHRFTVREGRVQEIFVDISDGGFVEVIDEPSTPALAQRLSDLSVARREGMRGEVSLALDDWASQVGEALERGFVLNIDYGDLAPQIYAPANDQDGTLVCFSNHLVGSNPYDDIGEQDITTHVDFSSLQRLGEQQGLTTVGYALQSDFLTNLGIESFLDDPELQDPYDAYAQLRLMAMQTLVEPEEMGDFKVLAQSKGLPAGIELQGFTPS